MAVRTRWFTYGEPVENDRVEAAIRTTYETGPGEPARTDDVRRGTVAIEVLGLLEAEPIAQHVHDDESVLLSALPDDAERELLATFEEDWLSQIDQLVRRGLSRSEAVDYVMTEERGLSQTIWAKRCDRTQQAIADSVRRAREHLGE